MIKIVPTILLRVPGSAFHGLLQFSFSANRSKTPSHPSRGQPQPLPPLCLQASLGACVVELEFPSHWFSQSATTRAELAYTLEPAGEGPGGCGPGAEEEPGEQALPVGGVELHPADPPQYQEVPLDEAVTLRAPDVPMRPGQLFTATLLLRHNFTANLLTLR